jgi:uncharacterized repeat protein (TIGR01451 family)
VSRSLLLALAIFATAAAPAAAQSDPPGCVNSDLQLAVTANKITARPGESVNFTVTASNNSAGACTITDATVVLHLPSATGTRTGEVKTLTTTGSFAPGASNTVVGTVPYTVAVNAGVTALAVLAEADFTAHTGDGNETDTAKSSTGVTVTQPALTLTATPSPTSGIVPLTSTVNYLLTNTSTTPAAMSNVVIIDPGCNGVTRGGGDTNGNALLDKGESWAYSCRLTLQRASEVRANVSASATNPVDQGLVAAPTVPWTVTGTAPPRPHITLAKTADPSSGVAPFNTTYTYTVTNDSDPNARPVDDVQIDDAGCSPAFADTPNDSLTAGEHLVFHCLYFLASPINLTASAFANGVDTYDGVRVYSNQATTSVTATASPVVVPAPEPTVVPTATPTPAPTNPSVAPGTPNPATKPSTRVKFAYTGRFSPAKSCRGTVALTLTAGKKRVATKKVKLDSKCRFKVSFDVARTRLAKATKVSVTAKATGKHTATKRLTVPKH